MKKALRICVDLDGTICEFRSQGQTYSDVLPKPGAVERLKELKAEGHTIIIHTARNMQTQGHNVGKVLKNVGRITLDWLDRFEVPYDEIFFGKPNADITIDDRVLRFETWSTMTKERILTEARDE
jgi:capsule biosynthesis phosphatase